MVLIPSALLIVTGLAILIIRRTQQRFRYSWLMAAGSSLVAWLFFLAMKWLTPAPILFQTWNPISVSKFLIAYDLDQIAWIYGVAIGSLLIAVILTSNARFQAQTNPTAWAGSLLVGGVCITAVMAKTPETILFSWMILDFIELFFVIRNLEGIQISERAITAFSFRITGIVLLLTAIALGGKGDAFFSFSSIEPDIGLILLIAVGLRLGLIPLHLPYRDETHLRWGYGSMLRLAVPLSTLVVLSRFPEIPLVSGWKSVLLVILASAVLYSGFKWFSANNEIDGRPYWLITIAGFSVISAINGQPKASMVWGIGMILSGAMIFLYSSKHKGLMIIPLLGIIGICAFPFTLASSGWIGILLKPFSWLNLVFLLSHALLMLGYIKHAFFTDENFSELDRWIQIVYIFGFAFPFFALILISFFSGISFVNLEFWWASLVSIVLFLIGGFIYIRNRFRKKEEDPEETEGHWLLELFKRIASPLEKIFNLEWVFRLMKLFFHLLQSIVLFFTSILDGESGVLWAVLLLVLILTIISFGGVIN
ncbi:MAG: hypothetical protein JEZ06_18800 [Anaerolineaceae bacterium]|nr:hypothetical protein [Anaerolineaceae bacterium]